MNIDVKQVYESKLVDKNDKVIVSTIELEAQQLTEMDSISLGIWELTQKINEQECNNCLLQVAKLFQVDIGHAQAAIDLIQESHDELLIIRPDLILTDSGWKLIEVNAGATVGGYTWGSIHSKLGFSDAYDPQSHFLQILGDKIKSPKEFIFVEEEQHLSYMENYCTSLRADFEKCYGVSPPFFDPASLTWDGKHLHAPTGTCSVIYPWFSERDLANRPQSYSSIKEAVQKKAVKVLMGPYTNILASKGLFPTAWELLEVGKLDEKESQFVKKYIPYSTWISEKNLEELIQRKDCFVIKPTVGYGGNDIVAGIETSSEVWRALLKQAIAKKSLPALFCQEMVDSRLFNLSLASNRLETQSGQMRVIWSPFYYAGSYFGGFIRAQPASCSRVINQATGAAVGPLYRKK